MAVQKIHRTTNELGVSEIVYCHDYNEVELIFAGRRTALPIQLVRHASSATGSKFVFNQGY